ncbi:translation initiation factor IF-2-like [Rousettus aegyptiacus]|uniref:translation initiation factor IF-2-like n=1 Tax=Rousettus aegyptiacus TaxID=9407 RepID=UPI00168D95A1|nr:translation initiation factor IF-2-like [Rousettus aegyptiacus]
MHTWVPPCQAPPSSPAGPGQQAALQDGQADLTGPSWRPGVQVRQVPGPERAGPPGGPRRSGLRGGARLLGKAKGRGLSGSGRGARRHPIGRWLRAPAAATGPALREPAEAGPRAGPGRAWQSRPPPRAAAELGLISAGSWRPVRARAPRPNSMAIVRRPLCSGGGHFLRGLAGASGRKRPEPSRGPDAGCPSLGVGGWTGIRPGEGDTVVGPPELGEDRKEEEGPQAEESSSRPALCPDPPCACQDGLKFPGLGTQLPRTAPRGRAAGCGQRAAVPSEHLGSDPADDAVLLTLEHPARPQNPAGAFRGRQVFTEGLGSPQEGDPSRPGSVPGTGPDAWPRGTVCNLGTGGQPAPPTRPLQGGPGGRRCSASPRPPGMWRDTQVLRVCVPVPVGCPQHRHGTHPDRGAVETADHCAPRGAALRPTPAPRPRVAVSSPAVHPPPPEAPAPPPSPAAARPAQALGRIQAAGGELQRGSRAGLGGRGWGVGRRSARGVGLRGPSPGRLGQKRLFVGETARPGAHLSGPVTAGRSLWEKAEPGRKPASTCAPAQGHCGPLTLPPGLPATCPVGPRAATVPAPCILAPDTAKGGGSQQEPPASFQHLPCPARTPFLTRDPPLCSPSPRPDPQNLRQM